MEKFKQLGISENIIKALKELGFSEPSEIQRKAIPLVLSGRDIIGGSATGSGKTLAFGVGLIEKIKKSNGFQGLVLTPTRELAIQIVQSLKKFSKYFPLNIIEIHGGVSINPQIEAIKKANIIVGTPGRILDHLNKKTMNLSKIEYLVLDEADRMLEMGFIDDVNTIIKSCSKNRQTLLFSATLSLDINELSKRYMRNPVFVSVESKVDPRKLSQYYFDVPTHLKFSLLVQLLKKEKSNLIMVFCSTRTNTDFVSRNLKKVGINAMAIHGGLDQNKRTRILKSFHDNEVNVLVCTDVAARGLDIQDVTHVYNYDSPKNSTDYIHRIGRTARAGKEGMAVSLISQRDYDNFRRVCEDRSLKITQKDLPPIETIRISLSGGLDRGKWGSQRDSRRSYNRSNSNRDHRSNSNRDHRSNSRDGYGSSKRFEKKTNVGRKSTARERWNRKKKSHNTRLPYKGDKKFDKRKIRR